jgi:hypothetical protein
MRDDPASAARGHADIPSVVAAIFEEEPLAGNNAVRKSADRRS